MSLLQYFKVKRPILPNPNGSLSKVMPCSSIIAANEAVKNAITFNCGDTLKRSLKGRGQYVQFTPEEKARIGKRGAECGIALTVRHFSNKKTFKDRKLKESSVRTWKTKYLNELGKRR